MYKCFAALMLFKYRALSDKRFFAHTISFMRKKKTPRHLIGHVLLTLIRAYNMRVNVEENKTIPVRAL